MRPMTARQMAAFLVESTGQTAYGEPLKLHLVIHEFNTGWTLAVSDQDHHIIGWHATDRQPETARTYKDLTAAATTARRIHQLAFPGEHINNIRLCLKSS